MSRSSRPMRGRKSSRRIDTDAIAAMCRDGRMWCKLGKVFKPDDQTAHWQVNDKGMILIEVETMPDGLDLTCRLATSGSGGGFGLWAIPRVGSIVAVLVPDGQIEFEPVIVGVLDNNAAPDGLDETLTLLADDRPVAIRAPGVQLGDSDATEAFIKGTSRRAHETALTSAIATYIASIQTIADPAGFATTALTLALTTYETAASGDLSTIVFGK